MEFIKPFYKIIWNEDLYELEQEIHKLICEGYGPLIIRDGNDFTEYYQPVVVTNHKLFNHENRELMEQFDIGG